MKIRAMVALDDDSGEWVVFGSSINVESDFAPAASQELSEHGYRLTRLVWVEAEIPAPPPPTLGEVERDG